MDISNGRKALNCNEIRVIYSQALELELGNFAILSHYYFLLFSSVVTTELEILRDPGHKTIF